METVCHYTSIESFQNMIANISHQGDEHFLTFWATSAYALNDPSEFMHGYELLKDSVLPAIEREIGVREKALKLSHVWKNVAGKISAADGTDNLISRIYENHENPFIISFSKQIDFLPMWNAYSNKGNGVCLCFNNNEYVFKNNEPSILNKLHAMEVTYGDVDDGIRCTIKELYKEYYQVYSGISDKQKREIKMMDYLIALIVVFSAYHKHKAYGYEQESRLVEFRPKDKKVHYRFGKNGQFIPYIEVMVKLKYLERVIVGPCADSDSVIREMKHQLAPYDITDIKPSSVPFREI